MPSTDPGHCPECGDPASTHTTDLGCLLCDCTEGRMVPVTIAHYSPDMAEDPGIPWINCPSCGCYDHVREISDRVFECSECEVQYTL